MSQDIDKFIKFLSDLNRGCHIEDLYDGFVYCLHNGQLRYVKSSTYRSHFFEVLNAKHWSLDGTGIDYVMECIGSHSLRIVFDPHHQPKQASHVRRVEL